MRLCGISSRFRLLSPCLRQVIHALLTRPPLSHNFFISEENLKKCFVRLACVRHAASVHPEPGSNSHKKVCAQKSVWLISSLPLNIYCFWLRNQVDCFVLKSEDFHLRILNESFKVVSLFSYQGACCLSVCGGNSDRISCPGRFVKDFLNFFSEPPPPEAIPCLSQLI